MAERLCQEMVIVDRVEFLWIPKTPNFYEQIGVASLEIVRHLVVSPVVLLRTPDRVRYSSSGRMYPDHTLIR